jgi:predicted Zn-dependent peptidase
MVAVLVGDLNPTEVKPILEKYFGSLPMRKQAARRLPVEPPQNSFRKIEVPFDAQPQVLVGWHKPTFPHRDAYVFEVLQYLLTANGRSARLFERLVKTDGLCESVECFTAPGDKYPNLFCVWMTPRAPHTAQEVQSVLWDELERLKQDPVTTEELQKTRNQIDASFLRELESNLGFARRLGAYYLLTRDANALDKFRDAMKSVTAEEIQAVAQRYFTLENTTVAEIVPKSHLSAPANIKIKEVQPGASILPTTSTVQSLSAK